MEATTDKNIRRVYTEPSQPEDGDPVVVTVEEVLSHKIAREQLLRDALRDMESFEFLYRPFEELSEVIAVSKEVRERLVARIKGH